MSRKPSLKPGTLSREEELERRVSDLERMLRRVTARSVSSGSDQTATVVNQTTHGFTVGNVIRHNGTSWTKSQADTAANAVVGGIVIAVLSPEVFVMATSGYVAGLTGLTAGSVHYLSAATAGALTTTAPAIAIPIILADSATSGALQSFWAGGGIAAPTEDGTIFCSKSDLSGGEWDFTVDIGRNAASKAGVLTLISPNASGDAVVINAELVTASTKKLTVREIDVCDAGVAKKMLVLASAPY
jgi:hypothetical protein